MTITFQEKAIEWFKTTPNEETGANVTTSTVMAFARYLDQQNKCCEKCWNTKVTSNGWACINPSCTCHQSEKPQVKHRLSKQDNDGAYSCDTERPMTPGEQEIASDLDKFFADKEFGKPQTNYVNSMTPEEQKADDELQRTAVITYTQPQPEQWEEEFDNRFWHGEELLKPRRSMLAVREFIADVLSRQKEQMLEVVRGMKVEEDEAKFADDPDKKLGEGYSIGYNSALSDVEEKIRGLH